MDNNIERKLAKLAALEAGGVENWEWYDESLKEYRATIEKEEMAEEFVQELLEMLCTEIDEPAGRGCGYGFSEKGQDAAVRLILNKVKEFKQ